MKNFRRFKLILLTFFTAFAVTAFVQCDLSTTEDDGGGTTTTGGSTPSGGTPTTDDPTTTDDTPTTDGTGYASMTFVNNSYYVVYYLRISLSTDSSWGPDQLGDNVIDTGGDSFTVTDIPVGTYDVRAETSTYYGYCAYLWNKTLTANQELIVNIPTNAWGSCSYRSLNNENKKAAVKSLKHTEAVFNYFEDENAPLK